METKRGKLISVHFDSVLDLDIQKYLNSNHINKGDFANVYYQRDYWAQKSSWKGPTAKSFDDIYNFASIGDNELYNKYLKPKIEELDRLIYNDNNLDNKNTVPTKKRKRTRKDFGDELDIQYVLKGKLDKAWQSMKTIQVDREHHLITLIIDISGNCNIKCNDTLWNAAACLKICDDLQKSGKSIQVIVAGCSINVTNQGSAMCISYTVKRYNEHISIERLGAMSHIGFYRTLGFLAKLTCQEKCYDNLGFSIHLSRNNLPFHVQDEIESGKTQVVILRKSLNLNEAYHSINYAYKQILDNSKKS